MTLNSTTQYALRAVLYVAEHGGAGPVRVDAIAADLHVPRNYLSKTMHALARAGILKSERGPRGGFQLARPARQISLGEVAAPFESMTERRCLFGRATCGWKNPCSAHPRWEAVAAAQRAFFCETTVADLLGEIADAPRMAPSHDIAAHEARPSTRGPAAGVRRPPKRPTSAARKPRR
ncbi:MAG: Rrf2 family transcriptional regulator [Gemmatimonadaceae bacterium]|nr:Rrf2 family transcriptional regulator [Gemmatimonadaceae bacterium]